MSSHNDCYINGYRLLSIVMGTYFCPFTNYTEKKFQKFVYYGFINLKSQFIIAYISFTIIGKRTRMETSCRNILDFFGLLKTGNIYCY